MRTYRTANRYLVTLCSICTICSMQNIKNILSDKLEVILLTSNIIVIPYRTYRTYRTLMILVTILVFHIRSICSTWRIKEVSVKCI